MISRDRRVVARLEAAVAARQDADHRLRPRRSAGPRCCARHDLARLAHRRARRQRDRVEDHAVGRALDLVDLADLAFDREVAVDDADAALARQRDGQLLLGDRVHRRRGERDVDRDVAREARRERGVARDEVGVARDEQDVVERQAFGEAALIADLHAKKEGGLHGKG
jgi:hypothetical protein